MPRWSRRAPRHRWSEPACPRCRFASRAGAVTRGARRARERGHCRHDRIADPARDAAGRPRALGRARRQRARHRRRLRRRRARRRAPTASATSTSPAASAARTSATTRRRSSSAIHAQVDQYLHQCFMVAAYEPYVDVCRQLGELSPCRGTDQKSILLQLRRRGGRERGQDRPRQDRPPGDRQPSTAASTAAR